MFDNPFEAAVITLFIIAAVAGVAIFATNPSIFGGGGAGSQPSTVSMWGTVDDGDIGSILRSSGIRENEQLTINYTEVEEDNLRNRLVNALARNEGPDTLLIPHTRLLQLEEFLTTIDSQAYTPRKFRNNFVEGTELFMRPNGIIGLPFAMDPLVMYWNRDMLSQAGFVSPPTNWNQVSDYIGQITEIDQSENISRAAIAIGAERNITRSQEIISALLLQANNPVVDRNSSNELMSTLSNAGEGGSARQTEGALRLYTQFANPSSAAYTWNDNLPQDRQAFISNQAAMYFDTGQAVSDIRDRNPNLNFDVAPIPQRSDWQSRTYGRMYGLAILERVPRQRLGRIFSSLQRLSGTEISEALLANTNLTPVRKDVVSNATPDEAYKSTLLEAAVTAQGWLDPNPEESNRIFSDMITDVISGQSDVSAAVNTASRSLDSLFSNE